MTNGANLGKHTSDVHEPSASVREPTLTYRMGTFRRPGLCGPVAWLDVVVVVDAERVHVKGLAKLQTLNLRHTKVTDAGVAELEKALPNCFIRTCQPPLPPLSRVTQPVSMNTRPVSECWRALVVWCTDVGICERGRHGGRPDRVAR
ncbi:MAG: hypothetical protein CMJ70_02975 [Planctomycetaceae bacterium]|nr:hypothetical protein [Planctomycetaceae bacterium]